MDKRTARASLKKPGSQPGRFNKYSTTRGGMLDASAYRVYPSRTGDRAGQLGYLHFDRVLRRPMSALPVDMRRDEPNIAEAQQRSVTVAAGVQEPNVGLCDISCIRLWFLMDFICPSPNLFCRVDQTA